MKAQRTACASNLRQLGLSWVLYKDDNAGALVASYPDSPDVWVQGDMTRASDATNADLIAQGKLFPYNRNPGIYHCPTDPGVTAEDRLTPTVRSYSMNSFMGARDPGLGLIPPNAQGFVPFFSRDSELRRPSELWVLIDEDERSITDGFFVTDPTALVWIRFPAISARRHNYSFTLNFADGHSEVWRNRDQRTGLVAARRTEQSGNLDLMRLARASTSAK